jgi:cell division protein FtsI (penicillin-binding protein 3)
VTENPLDAWRATMKRRLTVAAVVFACWAAVIESRLFHLQVLRHAALAAYAESQHNEIRRIPARRGDILDRNGEVLVTSVDATTINIAPVKVTDAAATAAALCAALTGCDRDEREALRARLSSGRKQAFVRRRASDRDAARVAALDLPGVWFETEPRRYYPGRELLAHTLGYVGTDPKGLAGLEAAYEDVIGGQDGAMLVLEDANHATVERRIETAPTTGSTLELTIDKHIQYVVDRELRRGVQENRALGGAAVVIDPWSGDVLATSAFPTFDPNVPPAPGSEALRNRAVQEVYEPGSTFKIVTASAALEQGVVEPDDIIDTSGGRIGFGSDYIYDLHDYKRLSFTDVFAKSSNVGSVMVALRLGPDRLIEYARRFGFGRRTASRDFPGEANGRVWNAADLKDSALARVSIGYQVSVTPLQMAAAVSSIANGGELIRPRILRAVITDGVRSQLSKRVINRTVTPAVAAQVTAMMEAVVERGTGTQAQIGGYAVAGKTGTARKWIGIGNGYSPAHYNASFVGFVPSRRPAYTIVVVIDSPRGANGYYGGPVAGPVFRRIAEHLLRRGAVPPTFDPPAPLIVDRQRRDEGSQPALADATAPAIVRARLERQTWDGLYPDLRGVSERDAVRRLAALGVQASIQGSGLVRDQRPAAGTPVEPGQRAVLWLSRDLAALRGNRVAEP